MRARRGVGSGPGATVSVAVAAVAVVVVLVAAGCGDQAGSGAAGEPDTDGVLSVAEALDHEGDEPVTVEGLVLSDGNGTYLCSALAESFPPQCGSPAVNVVNLELATVDGLQEEGTVRWSERLVRVQGRMLGGVLTLDGPPASFGESVD